MATEIAMTNLAKLRAKRLGSRTVSRATAAIGLALGLALELAMGTQAVAAPPPKPPVDNPFEGDKSGAAGQEDDSAGSSDGDDEQKGAAGQQGDGEAPAPQEAAPARPSGENLPGGDRAGGEESREAEGGAEDEETQGDEEPESALHGLTCLEGDATGSGRRKGVQRRDFLKRHRAELSGVGGWYASDALSSTYTYGGALAFYPSEDMGLEVLVTRTPVRFRLEEPFSSFDNERHFIPGVAWQAMASMLWSPIHAKFKFTDETIIHGDIFVVAGVGRTFHETVQGLTWEAGLGLKLYFTRFVTFRLDVRDFLVPQEVLGRGRVTNNITVLAGFSLWLPG